MKFLRRGGARGLQHSREGGHMGYTFKHLVIVHGIGDQQMNETIINFMNEFVRAMPDAIRNTVDVHNLVEREDPGKGSPDPPKSRPAYLLLDDSGKGYVIGFSEVFWQPVTNEYLKLHK